jgi:hypothetical protein
MDVADALRGEAGLLRNPALRLIRMNRDETGEASEKPAHDLGHATVRFSLALEALADAADAAQRESEARFDRSPPPGDGLAGERAQLGLLSVVFAGDFALDSFAWAELVRRGDPPRRGKDGRVPILWPRLMEKLNAGPTDPITAPARFLDVTLDAARDALGAHRDPELEQMVGSGTGGYFSIDLVTLDPARIERARRCLDRIVLPLPYAPSMVESSPQGAYRMKVQRVIGASSILDGPARADLRRAYRWGGITSPPMAQIAARFRQLVDIYIHHGHIPATDRV